MTTQSIRTCSILLVLLAFQLISFPLVQAKDRASLRGLVAKKTSRITNGNMAEYDRFPYFSRMIGVGCGGVLISKRFVLTAAHCLYFLEDVDDEYFIDDSYQDDYYDDLRPPSFGIGAYTKSNGTPINIGKTVLHPSYSGHENDIAVVYLAEEAVDKPYVKLSPDMINEPGTSMTVIGLGHTSHYYDSYSGSSYLQKADVEYIDSGVCRLDYPKESIDSGMMCTASEEGKDSCGGDSGGPLLLTPSNKWEEDLLVGIVSWGYGCGDSRYPGVYTRVSLYYDWIVETMCSISPEDAPEYCDPPGGRIIPICGNKGAACHANDECCSGRCDLFSNTCFGEVANGGGRPARGSTGMGGAAGGTPPARGSRIRDIERDLP